MGREVWIYTLRQTDQLQELLSNTSQEGPSFASFLAERRSDYGASYTVDYHHLLKTAKTDIQQLLPQELFEITYWLEEKCRLDEVAKVYDDIGIDKLYESLTKSEAHTWMTQYYTFWDSFQLEQENVQDDAGTKIGINDFILFLDYLILLLDRINQAGISESFFHYPDAEKEAIEKINHQRKAHKKLSNLVKREVRWLEKMISEKEQAKNKPSRETDLLDRLEYLIITCLAIRKKLEEHPGYVFTLDSV